MGIRTTFTAAIIAVGLASGCNSEQNSPHGVQPLDAQDIKGLRFAETQRFCTQHRELFNKIGFRSAAVLSNAARQMQSVFKNAEYEETIGSMSAWNIVENSVIPNAQEAQEIIIANIKLLGDQAQNTGTKGRGTCDTQGLKPVQIPAGAPRFF